MRKFNLAVKLLPFVISLVVSGCSWFHEADLPKITTPTKFNSAESNINVESLPYLAWWQQFNDKNLNYLIESGLKNNLDINIALSNLEQSKGQLKQIQLSWLPFVSLYGGYSSNPVLGDIGTFYGVWPQYSINILQTFQKQKVAKYNVQTYEAMADGVRLTIIGQIASSYFSLIALQRQLELFEQLNIDLGQIISFNEQEIKIGLRDTLEVDGIKAEQYNIQGQIEVIKHNIKLSNNSLTYLLNENPSEVASSNNFATLDFSKFKPGDLPSNVLQNRPDVQMAGFTLQASNANVGVAYSNLFPILQLDKFFGRGSSNGTYATPNNYVSLQDAYLNWGINPSTFGQIEAGKGAYQAQVYTYIQTIRKVLRDVDNSLSANNRYNTNYLKINLALKTLSDKYDLQKGLYKSGIISYPKLLQNKIELDNAKINENQAKLNQALALVNLYQELAGGYLYSHF